MIRIGLTGGIAAGKSTVVRLLQSWNIPVFDADKVVHQLYRTPHIIRRIAQICPQAQINGSIERGILKRELAKHPIMLADIEAVIHPAVRDEESRFMKHFMRSGVPVVCADIPLLFEGKNAHRFDVTWLVIAPLWLRKARILKRGTMNEAMMENVLSRQWSDAQKIPLADWCLHSGIGRDFMACEVKRAYMDVMQRSRRIAK